MMKITVMNRRDAVRYSFHPQQEKTSVISISTPDEQYHTGVYTSPYNGISSVLRLWFDDVESGKDCIRKEDAEKIKRFVEAHKEDSIIVHCDAGVSRSAGIAAALMKYYNGDDTPIFNNPKYCPNMLCYRTMLNTLMEGDRS